jgi:hypothetical protein
MVAIFWDLTRWSVVVTHVTEEPVASIFRVKEYLSKDGIVLCTEDRGNRFHPTRRYSTSLHGITLWKTVFRLYVGKSI